ncbi:MAG: ABC transporter ATP-binding protein [bacterium]|jgi:branched-chain amino acid transport system ATP-binding protein
MSILEVIDLWKSFGGMIAVKGVSFSVRKGELLGIIGPNGAGKTTLYNLITGFYRPDRGRILLYGEDITGVPPHKLARKGLVRTFQLVRPFLGMTVLENVLVPIYARFGMLGGNRNEIIKEAREKLKIVGLLNKEELLAEVLSHGEKKKLEIARALAINPDILLLDEPVGGLTPKEIDEIVDLIREVHKSGITVIIIEHNMRAIMNLCRRILVLNFGEILAEGTPEEIKSNPKVIEAYLGEKYAVGSG